MINELLLRDIKNIEDLIAQGLPPEEEAKQREVLEGLKKDLNS